MVSSIALSMLAAMQTASGNADPAVAGICTAHFTTGPVASWDANGRTMTLVQQFEFVDAGCRHWAVPAGAVVDGASIPSVLWSLMGGPFEGPYRNASVVHDWFCARRTVPWEAVDRMFYDGMIVSGVPKWKAEAFYWAVLKAGPHWDDLTIRNNRLGAGHPSHSGYVGEMQVILNRNLTPAPANGTPPSVAVSPDQVKAIEDAAKAGNLTPEQIEYLAATGQ